MTRIAATLAALFLTALQAVAQADPLPSWNDGPAKSAILAFVASVTTASDARLRAGARAHRHLRQRRHAAGRAADVLPDRSSPWTASARCRRSTPNGTPPSRSPRCFTATAAALAGLGDKGFTRDHGRRPAPA